MKRLLLAAGLAAIIAAGASAHPHARVDQQAHISVNRSAIAITFRIVPSTLDGAHMFDHLDVDRNGAISPKERSAFTAALLAGTKLVVDGRRVPLSSLSSTIPRRALMAAGNGLIQVKARAATPLHRSKSHSISVSIDYRQFAPGWHLQPFLQSDMLKGRRAPVIARPRPLEVRIAVPAS